MRKQAVSCIVLLCLAGAGITSAAFGQAVAGPAGTDLAGLFSRPEGTPCR